MQTYHDYTTLKFMLHDSLACKRAYGGGYLLGGKRQAYHAGNTINLPPTYFPIKTLRSRVAAGHLGF